MRKKQLMIGEFKNISIIFNTILNLPKIMVNPEMLFDEINHVYTKTIIYSNSNFTDFNLTQNN